MRRRTLHQEIMREAAATGRMKEKPKAVSERCFPQDAPPDQLTLDCYHNNPNCSCRQAEQTNQ
jgi:hypothetical protein